MSTRFLRINCLLAILGIGWALYSRFSQASHPGGILYPSKVVLRSIASPELLTNLEHLTSAIGTPCALVAMLWYIYHLSKESSRLRLLCTKLFPSQCGHYGRWAVVLSFGVYLVHQVDKEFFTAGNRANQFAWDLGGMVIGLFIVVRFLSKNYRILHSDEA